MSREEPEGLAPSEWKVMKIVWRRKKCATRDVCDEAEGLYGWSQSTTKTLLRRLVEKKHLSATAVGNSFQYRPTRPAIQAVLGAADALLENVFEEMTGPLLAHIVQKRRLTDDQIARLRALLDEQQADPLREEA